MSGPEHYVEAERLLASGGGDRFEALAAAQIHATLALAAATAVAPGLWTTAWDEAIT